MCLLDFKILTFTIPNFVAIYYPSVYQFCTKKHPILLKLGVFYTNLLKMHPIYVNWVPLSVIKPPIAIPKFTKNKKHLKRQSQICIPCQCETSLASESKYWEYQLKFGELQKKKNENCNLSLTLDSIMEKVNSIFLDTCHDAIKLSPQFSSSNQRLE